MMKQKVNILLLLGSVIALLITACNPSGNVPEEQSTQTPAISENATSQPTLETAQPENTQAVQTTTSPSATAPTVQPTPSGPINPLTGLPPADPALLDRRPVLVKIENLPRSDRPQSGLSLADLVYEYHTEEGTTRFAAIYYGNNATQIGPVRSGRVFDIELVYMYGAQFVFAGAYQTVLARIRSQEFRNRLIVEDAAFSPALFRAPGSNLLMLNLEELNPVLQKNNIDNTRQELEGMTFQPEAPTDGEAAGQVYFRYSSAIYNRWDYDAQTGKYLRFVDNANAYSVQDETYAQLTDRSNDQPIAADNVVMIMVKNVEIERNIYEIQLKGSGQAFIARDGQIYEVRWSRADADDLLILEDLQGNPFPFKSGQTWFEILSDPATVEQEDNAWRFTFQFPR